MQGLRSSSGMAIALSAITTLSTAAQTAPPTAATVPGPGLVQPTQPIAGDPGSRNAVEQIVVTANKRRERAREVANSVTAITGAQLERRQQLSVQDLVSQVPGLSVEADDKTTVRIIIRGLNA